MLQYKVDTSSIATPEAGILTAKVNKIASSGSQVTDNQLELSVFFYSSGSVRCKISESGKPRWQVNKLIFMI